MAPLPPETIEQVEARARREVAAGAKQVRIGAPRRSHVICSEGDRWRLRDLQLTRAQLDAAMTSGRPLTPEAAEQMAQPGEKLLLEAPSLNELLAALSSVWPPAAR